MDTYHYKMNHDKAITKADCIKVGVAGSGNLEVIVEPHDKESQTHITVNTTVTGFKKTWDAMFERFMNDYPLGGLKITLNDAGATPPVVALRLRQAIETYNSGYSKKDNYRESSPRTRIQSLVDKNSFEEFLLDMNTDSPNLPKLNMQVESDDGVVIGTAKLKGNRIAIIAQQKDFIGGSVGEIHGAKIIGLIKYAIKNKIKSIVFLIDSGGVRLQEANVGEIEISEIIRCILDAKSKGIKTIGVVCGNNGAYGGMGIISGSLDYLIVNQIARIGVSGAEVIQAVEGAEVLNSADRALVWRIYGGRTRFIQKAAQAYTTNLSKDIREAVIDALSQLKADALISESIVKAEHDALKKRVSSAKKCTEEGQWLKKNKPDWYKKDVFNMSDEDFMSLFKGK